jgi:hypothetical protein
MKWFCRIIVFFIFCGMPFAVSADIITLKSGSRFKGKVLRKKNGTAAVWVDELGSEVREIPLADILKVEKEVLAPHVQQILAKIDPSAWGGQERGLQAQLLPLSREYVVGQPMLFGLVLTNASTQAAWYDPQQVSQNDPFTIKDFNGERVPFLSRSRPTVGHARPLDPGESVVLLDGFDISRFYPIVKSGRHTIQHSSFREWIPHSNTLTFDVKPGEPSLRDILVSRIFQAISSEQWLIVPAISFYKSQSKISEKISVHNLEIFYLPRGWEFYQGETMQLWVSPVLLDVTDTEIPKDPLQRSEYLGTTDTQQHVYVNISSPVYAEWPDMKERVAKALKIYF